MTRIARRFICYLTAIVISLVFVYPFYWLTISSFRTQEAVLTVPLRLLPEALDLEAYRAIQRVGGVDLGRYLANSLVITLSATALATVITTLGAYALFRQPHLPLFRTIRFGFLTAMMYPAMLLVIPVYFIMHKFGLLGSYAGVVIFLGFMPVLFLMLSQFFRSIPGEIIEAARMDGASETQILLRVVLPITRPILYTVFLIGFLLNWKQWLPILIIAGTPEYYTLPVALLSMSTEFGQNVQSMMALAALTTLPIVVLFIVTQKRVIGGLIAGAVKG